MRKADIEVFSDFTCPWCYITTRRMHSAIQGLPADVRVEVFWRPFPIDAATSRSAFENDSTRRFLASIGEAEGIKFAFHRIGGIPDTLDAQRMIWLTARDGQSGDVVADLVDRVYRAYFSEGRDIGDRKTLAEIAAAAGLDPVRITEQLAGPDGIVEVHALGRRARELGIEAPPFLLVNNMVGIPGSRSTASLREKIEGGSWFGVERRRKRVA